MDLLICCVPCSPLRAHPAHPAEMVSQLFFGESCTVIDWAKDQWVKIKNRYDGYEGWCQESHLTAISVDEEAGKEVLTKTWITEIEFDGQSMKVPFGTPLTVFEKKYGRKKNRLHYRGKPWEVSKAKPNKATVRQLSAVFLNSPYLWGGRTVFGTDCSGYTQTVFRFLDIALLRDASQQATQGEPVEDLSKAKCGDLAFFNNDAGKITHVGILLNKKNIIHASGKVRIDGITGSGIVHADNGTLTHRLKEIRRYYS